MARVLMTLLGAGVLALGVWLCVIWWPQVSTVLLALVALTLVLIGLAVFILGISELAGAKKSAPDPAKEESTE